ncbi:hypothetical protein HV077_07940 [Citrobacter freundii]|uniref:Uncharacterized protein n=1 Tax=Citrobacter freundii TaxID=546 RepID=A0A7W3D3H2_CITFR|nr:MULTISPECIES: hypothetical protein [Citrobacter]MBD0827606.1 hypothetical protein [Citrobacter sp. C1]HEO8445180.1 hypothetical protein [Yersinia enterocolitica]MBA8062326.1 hypothetical protein [Citrobacter freundii]QLO02504.1 hypothetical protein HV141_02560 [Citrobacter freundii]RFU89368.1 hypothetical protein DZA29_22680 [Citrobacter gillenii]
MFKSFNTEQLKLALCKTYQSGWTLVVMVVLSLWLCSFYGRNAFIVWWMPLSGIVLIGASIFLGNLPYRLIQPAMYISKFACLWSWLIWVAGAILLALAPVFSHGLFFIWLDPLGALIGVMFCCWVSRKGLLKWIR